MLRGLRNGWIDRKTYEPLGKAWTGILARTGADGRLVDVSERTGTRSLTDDDTFAAPPSSAATIAAEGGPCSSRSHSPACKGRAAAKVTHLRGSTLIRN